MSTELPPQLTEAVESVVSGWYPAGTSVQWADLLDRVEDVSGVDLGTSLDAPLVKAVRAYASELRTEG